MASSSRTLQDLREILLDLQTMALSAANLTALAPKLARLVQADYFGIYTFGEPRQYISNSSPEYKETYLSVAAGDYMRDALLTYGKEYLWSHHPEYVDDAQSREFIEVCFRVRPLSDTIYSPVKLGRAIRGYTAFARSSHSGPAFSDDEAELVRFVMAFLNDAFERSDLPPALEDELAQVNADGEILAAGAAFSDLWQGSAGEGLRSAVGAALRAFLAEPLRRGAEFCSLRRGRETWTFQFSLQREEVPAAIGRDRVAATIRLIDAGTSRRSSLDLSSAAERFRLSSRELQVVRALCEGKSNKVIAGELGVEESTVKRHTHNIYEKTGFASRVELVVGLG